MEPFLGQIQPFGFNFAPRGWATCDGQLLAISSHSALFSLLGTTYGGDGRTTFALPDLRGRVSFQMGNGPGLSSHQLGSKGGTEKNVHNVTNLPSHTHAISLGNLTGTQSVNRAAGEQDTPENAVPATRSDDSYSGTPNADGLANSVNISGSINLSNQGGQQPVNNIQPFLVVNWCIALVGIFPSRS